MGSKLIGAVIVMMLVAGCVFTVWRSEPEKATVSNKYFTAEIKPVCKGNIGCEAFILTIVNKAESNIEVNWNKTLYISHGQTSGGFMFEGVVYKDRNMAKPPDIVFSNGTLTKAIWPNKLVYFAHGWDHHRMPSGDNGVYLSVFVDGKEVNERLVVRLSESRP